MKKTAVLELLEAMPDEIDPDDLMYRLFLRGKVERAEAAVRSRDVLTQEEVDRLSDEWLS